MDNIYKFFHGNRDSMSYLGNKISVSSREVAIEPSKLSSLLPECASLTIFKAEAVGIGSFESSMVDNAIKAIELAIERY